MICHLLRLEAGEEGQGLTEYALILTFIAIVAIAALLLLGGSLASVLSMIGDSVARTT